MYKKTELPNGLRVTTHDMKGRDSLSIGLWIGVGGRYEADPIKGAAHFLEHIVFKGSKKFGCEEIKEKIEGIGGSLNAFTSEEQTCFYAKIPSKFVESTFDVLADMVLFPKITQKDVTKESTVIIEEIKMYHDLSQYYVLELLDALLWPKHPLGKSLAGSMKTVAQMTAKNLKDFHSQHYIAKNIVVSACGNVTHKKIVDLVTKKLGSLNGSYKNEFAKVTLKQDKPRACYHKRNIEQMHLALGMPGLHESHKDRFILCLLNIILGGNMSSRLFVEVRENRGLAYSISSTMKALQDTGVFMIRAGVDNNKLVDAVKVIIKELDKIGKEGVSADEFKRGRDYLLGQLLLGLEDTMEHMLWLGESVISKNKMRTLQSVIKEYEKITRADIKRIAKEVLNKEKYSLAIVGPITPTQEKDLNTLLGI